MTYTVEYQAGTYHGTRTVHADDGEHAKALVRTWVRRQMTLPMYAESYRIVRSDA
jgi:hypothetical protein